MKNLTPTVHSQVGASGMHRWSQCPGSVRLCRNAPKTTSSYADEGTLAHEIAAAMLSDNKIPAKLLNSEYFYAEMIEEVEVYTKFVWDEFMLVASSSLHVEKSFDLSEKIYPGLFGTADAVIYNPETKHLSVVELKFGRGHLVEVKDNPQLMYYGMGALAELNKPCSTVSLTIVQPRAFHPDGPIRTWQLDAIDILDFEADLIEYVKKTEEPDAPLVPGDHCFFCPAKALCPALEKQALSVAKDIFDPVVNYDPEKLSKSLELIPQLESWIKGVREFAYLEAERGNPPPGFKLVAKRAIRKWVDEQAIAHTLKQKGYKNEDVFTLKVKSPAQIEKVVPKKETFLEGHITAVSSGNTLAPESDKRPAVLKLGAQDVFDDVLS